MTAIFSGGLLYVFSIYRMAKKKLSLVEMFDGDDEKEIMFKKWAAKMADEELVRAHHKAMLGRNDKLAAALADEYRKRGIDSPFNRTLNPAAGRGKELEQQRKVDEVIDRIHGLKRAVIDAKLSPQELVEMMTELGLRLK